jgi:hypothetical protein
MSSSRGKFPPSRKCPRNTRFLNSCHNGEAFAMHELPWCWKHIIFQVTGYLILQADSCGYSMPANFLSKVGWLFLFCGIQLVHLLPLELSCAVLTFSFDSLMGFLPRLHEASCHLPMNAKPGWKNVNKSAALTIIAPSRTIKVIC